MRWSQGIRFSTPSGRGTYSGVWHRLLDTCRPIGRHIGLRAQAYERTVSGGIFVVYLGYAYIIYYLLNSVLSGISPAEADAQWASRRSQLVNKGGMTQQETEQIMNLVRSMLVLDPEKRPSAAGLVELNSWLR